jgi:hypothetical protein
VPIVDVLIDDGDQVPVMAGALFELRGSIPGVVFWQYGPSCVKLGVTPLVITTVIVVTTPHCPANGVKVYVNEPIAAVLITDGDQVPFILLLD